MKQFSSLDLQRNASMIQEVALKEPVAITYHGRNRLVILSAEEYERLCQRQKQVLAVEEFPEEFLEALKVPVHDEQLARLDYLMDA